MTAFARGEADVLVATTVIEVGVDVPNATLMVIEDADRFGLSQLHQLRGRVGRGGAKSYCILTSHNRNPETLQRLKALCKTTDGFQIAEEDLRLRGPGDFFGSRQSGLPAFRVADLSFDLKELKQAQEATAAYVLKLNTLYQEELEFLSRLGEMVPPASEVQPDPSAEIEASVSALIYGSEAAAQPQEEAPMSDDTAVFTPVSSASSGAGELDPDATRRFEDLQFGKDYEIM